ncbi:hypothetical protein SAMN05421684_2456 [Asanoa ishikariensis]|uniref:Lipoprotein n=1 Tax=Asanoa ishikariensis TaxID=137265 RepID=A0A1H3P038_9ACTN|nr:hypothetical protein [Asanoa ishikariensis]SDY94155.1 hypothetical protein SAMN05421684_2456 [Asanoa ishikariensis]
MALRRIVAVAVVALLAAGGCGKALGGRVVYQGDYPRYQSVAELLERATLVVEATTANPRFDKLYPTDGEKTEETAVVITVYDATVTKVHKGSARVGQVVQVKQMGGEIDGVVYEQPEQVPFRDGTPYLLFLETYPDAAASLLNPDQAQYEVDPAGGYKPLGDNTLTVTAADLTP